MLGSDGLESEELERNCSRSRSLWSGKPLDDRSRSSHLEPDFPVGIEQSIGGAAMELQKWRIREVNSSCRADLGGKFFGLGF